MKFPKSKVQLPREDISAISEKCCRKTTCPATFPLQDETQKRHCITGSPKDLASHWDGDLHPPIHLGIQFNNLYILFQTRTCFKYILQVNINLCDLRHVIHIVVLCSNTGPYLFAKVVEDKVFSNHQG